jgi:hypothetical protein
LCGFVEFRPFPQRALSKLSLYAFSLSLSYTYAPLVSQSVPAALRNFWLNVDIKDFAPPQGLLLIYTPQPQPKLTSHIHRALIFIGVLTTLRIKFTNMSSSIVVRLPSPAHDRVIYVTNVHFAADSKTLEELFESYAIQDQHRTTNTCIGTKSVVYVLFATVADKIRSFELSGSMLFDREIKIQPAPQGNYTRETLWK